MNIRSVLGNNFDELCLNLNKNKAKFSVIVLSETCLVPNENHSILEGYTSYAVCRNCNKNDRGGGSLVYVLDKLSSIKVEGISKKNSSLESIGVELTLSAYNVIYICGIYRPHGQKLRTLTENSLRWPKHI